MTEEAQRQESSQEPQKGLWTALKDNAAVLAAIIGLVGVIVTGGINTYIANKDELTQQKLEDLNAKAQRALEENKAQNAALQTYLSQMDKKLLNQHLRDSSDDSVVRAIAQAQTSTVLRQLDSEGKVIVLLFLNDAGLLSLPDSPADIRAQARKAVRQGGLSALTPTLASEDSVISIARADFSHVVLRYSELSSADLRCINLSSADLSKANLTNAELSRADLTHANLSGAHLSGADLGEADLSKADLSKADLSRAYLYSATGWTEKQLGAARSLEGATMPNGQKYEDWIKDREGRKEGGTGE